MLAWPIWTLKTQVMAKRKANSQIDNLTQTIKSHPNSLMCRWHATYCWKTLNKGYNFTLNLISIRGFHSKLLAPKVPRVLTLRISGLPLGSLETKWHLGVDSVARHKVYYKGEGGGFPQVCVTTLALGLWLRQRGCKVAGQKEAQESRQRHCKGAGQEEARESHHILLRV